MAVEKSALAEGIQPRVRSRSKTWELHGSRGEFTKSALDFVRHVQQKGMGTNITSVFFEKGLSSETNM